jgi:hypothetical protein
MTVPDHISAVKKLAVKVGAAAVRVIRRCIGMADFGAG